MNFNENTTQKRSVVLQVWWIFHRFAYSNIIFGVLYWALKYLVHLEKILPYVILKNL